MNDLLSAIHPLLPAITADADRAERERQLSDEIVRSLADAGAVHMLVPRALGGGEVHPLTFLEVIEALAVADASTSWVVMIAATSAISAAFLESDVARKVYGDGPGVITGGIFGAPGKAIPVEGGYRISGRWPFGSGCRHASWMSLNCMVEAEQSEGRQPPATFFFAQVPASDYTIVDTWDVSGLRATGSHDIEVADAFVPSAYGYAIGVDRARHEGHLYSIPVLGLLAVAVASVSLGIGRGALDDIRALATAKKPTARRRTVAEWPVAQVDYARAEAALRSGRAYLVEAINDIWATIESGDRPSTDLRAHLRLAATAATRGAVTAVDIAYEMGGGSSIYSKNTLQRRSRDIHTLTQHIMVGQSSFEGAGRALLGLDVPPGFL